MTERSARHTARRLPHPGLSQERGRLRQDASGRRRVAIPTSSTIFDDADVVIVNTCSFIKEATEESVAVVLELASEWAPLRDDRKLVVAGCMPSRYGDELDSAMPEVDAFVPVADEASAPCGARAADRRLDGCARGPPQARAAQIGCRTLRLPADLGRLPPQLRLLHDSRRSVARTEAASSPRSLPRPSTWSHAVLARSS